LNSARTIGSKKLNVSLRGGQDTVTLVEVPVSVSNLQLFEEDLAVKQIVDLKNDLEDLINKSADQSRPFEKDARWHGCKVSLVAQRR